MSFASELKTEIVVNAPRVRAQRKSLAYGMAAFGRSFSGEGISLQTEHQDVASLYSELLGEIAGTAPAFKRNSTATGATYTVTADPKMCKRILNHFGHDPNAEVQALNLAVISGRASATAFFTGVFLSCGNIVDPQKSYHCEFVVQSPQFKSDLAKLLEQHFAKPKISSRRSTSIVYYKESEQIEDLMTMMGAGTSSMELMNVKIIKDLRNKINRVTNCETANIEKTVAAASAQIAEINFIAERRGLSSLSDDLFEIACLRLENPDMTLQEIGESLNPVLSRSGVNHRMRRILKTAKELREIDGGAK